MAEGKLRVGNVEVQPVTDAGGLFPVKLTQLFAGSTLDQWEHYRQRYPGAFADADTWSVHVGGCLVRSAGRTVLIDTGIGPQPDQGLFPNFSPHFLDELAALGVKPDDVDTVFMTHAHPDHVGWNLTLDRKPTFARARYVLSQADWDALPAMQAVMPPYIDRMLTPLEGLGVLDLLSGETALTDELVAIPTPGHTPGHMSMLISSGGERALIVGDALVHPAQVTETEWVFGFDADGQRAIATRKQLVDRIEAEGMKMVTCHFPQGGVGQIIRLEGRRYWQAL